MLEGIHVKSGEVIRYIRKSKRIKSKSVYANILSRPAISKFEKGISDTTTDKLFEILDNLNISLEEFYFIYNIDKVKEENIFLKEYFESFYSSNIKKLLTIRTNCKNAFDETNKIKYLHYSALTDLTVSYISQKEVNSESLEIIKKYLLECEEWNYYELILFTNALDFFSEDLILLLFIRAKKKLASFSQIRKYNNEVFVLVLNIIIFFIEKNDIEKSSFFYNELLSSTSETNNKMYEKTMIIFLNHLLYIMKTKKEPINEVEKIISIFNYLDMPLKAKQCSLLFQTVKRNNLVI